MCALSPATIRFWVSRVVLQRHQRAGVSALESHSALGELQSHKQLSLVLHETVDALVEDGRYPQPELREYDE